MSQESLWYGSFYASASHERDQEQIWILIQGYSVESLQIIPGPDRYFLFSTQPGDFIWSICPPGECFACCESQKEYYAYEYWRRE